MCKHQQRFGRDVQCSALIHNFSNIFSNGHLYRAGRSMNSLPSQILEPLCVTLFSILQTFKHPRLCRSDPTQFLAHGKAHKTPTQSQPCQELKMLTPKPTHHPADGILMSFTSNISRIFMIINNSHFSNKLKLLLKYLVF